MSSIRPLWLAILAAAALAACRSTETSDQTLAATNQWLAAQTGKARTNVSGAWRSDDWGIAYLSQTGRRITGHLGKYPVTGVVSGHKAYLAVSEDGWSSYTVILEVVASGQLKGYYSSSSPFSAADQKEITLFKTGP